MAAEAEPETLTLGEAIKDLGWFPLAFAIVIGGPSVLAILESVLVNHQLVPALQWIVDGYNRVMAVLGAVVEPLIDPAIDWVNARLNWTLTLDPVWRPLFALGMVYVLGFARTEWRAGYRGLAVRGALAVGFGALVGAVLAGIVPGDGGWWAQGLRAAVPLVSLVLLSALTASAVDLARGDAAAGRELRDNVVNALFFGLFAFGFAVGLSFVPGLGAGAGVLTLGGVVALFGVVFLAGGLSGAGNRTSTRVGLTILGGFVAAGVILAADAGLKALGAG